MKEKIKKARFYRAKKTESWKQALLYAPLLTLAVFLLPALLATFVGQGAKTPQNQEEEAKQIPLERETEREETRPLSLQIFDVQLREHVEMELDEYLVGVVAAEMPARFHLEALKAQAVAARTYALHRTISFGGNGCPVHKGADLCTDSTCCQAWVGEEEMNSRWPREKALEFDQRVTRAVATTRGMVVTYGEDLAQTLYHSTCGGMTEAAGNVWDGSNPGYLQSVVCPFCHHSRHFQDEISMALSDYVSALKNESGVLPVLGEGNAPHLEVVSRSPSGRNLLVRLGSPGRVFQGTEIRNLLELPSTHFQWHVDRARIIFTTRGFGHGVGLCQYGADGMAREGKGFDEILAYYYRNTDVSPWTDLFD